MAAPAGRNFPLKGAELNAHLSPPRSGNDLAFPIFAMLPFNLNASVRLKFISVNAA